MVKGGEKKAKKENYFAKLQDLSEKYSKILVVEADNVGSSHMQKIRKALRKKNLGVVLMGKNTMMRKAIRLNLSKNSKLEAVLPHLKGNVGFVFTNSSLPEVKDLILAERVMAPAKVGVIAPCDVIVPKGPTGMEPTMTAFLQALNISSKINKGQVEIVQDVHLIKTGDRVGSSESTLLAKLNIMPFSYGLKVKMVYDDGFVYKPQILELTDADLIEKFQFGVSLLNSIALEIGFPTVSSLPHSIINSYKTLIGIALETSYSFPAVEKIKHILENPDAFAAAPAAGSGASTSKVEKVEEKEEEKKKEEEEEDFGGGIDLFGGDEDF